MKIDKVDVLLLKAAEKSLDFFVREFLHAEPTPQQQQVIDDIDRGRRKISIRSGHGCFAIGHKVLMADGTIKSVEDIKVGDTLMGDDGVTKRNVLELKGGSEKMYRFKFNSGDEHIYNASHKLVLVATQAHGKQKTGDITEVEVRDWLLWSNRRKRTHAIMKNSVQYSKKDLDIPPYILGAWLGDGHSRSAMFTNVDGEVIQEFQSYADNNCLTMKARDKKTYSLSNNWQGNRLLDGLKKYNLINNKHIPQIYKTASIEQRLELLAGLIDTDGYLDSRKNAIQYEITQKSFTLAKDIVSLVQSVGIHATINEVFKACTNTGAVGTYYRINISRNSEIIPCKVHRKKPTGGHKKQRGNLHFGIKSAEPLGVGEYYGFTLDGNHRFLSGDYIVTRNTGKTSLLSWIVLWWGIFKDDAKIPMTAPTAHQLFDLLLPEIKKWYNNLPDQLKNEVDIKTERIDYANGNFAVARTARKEQPEALQGFHATSLAFIIDEASGIPQVIFEVAEGAMTGDDTLVIMTANPTRVEGYFYDSQHKNRWQWSCYQFNAELSPNVSKKWIEEKKRQYGADSDTYKIRVLGDFPSQSSNSVFSLPEIEDAINAETYDASGAEIWALDVADFGDDKNVLAKRSGKMFQKPIKKSGLDVVQIAGWLLSEYKNAVVKPQLIFVDTIGVGSGVPAVCHQVGLTCVMGVKASNKASNDEVYFNKRAEWYHNLKEMLKDGKLPDDQELVGELMAQKYIISGSGKIQLISKKEIKSELGRSPDTADAFAMTCNDFIEYILDDDVIEAEILQEGQNYAILGWAG